MIEAWSAADVRAAEKPLLDAGVPLMDRAAFALAAVVRRDLARRRAVAGPDGELRDGSVRGARVALLVGPGNNGGDALYAGAYLARRGLAVTAYLAAERVHDQGLAALRAVGGRAVTVAPSPSPSSPSPSPSRSSPSSSPSQAPWPSLQLRASSSLGDVAHGRVVGALAPLAPLATPAAHMAATDVAAHAARSDVVVDGLLGIGATGALRGTAAALVAALLAALPDPGDPRRPLVVAVDAPSGLGVDDGTLPGPVLPADRTVTLGAAKPGLLLPPATHAVGAGAVIDIGLDLAGPPAVRRLEDTDVAASWVVPRPGDHKYTRGVVGVVAGTATFPGAAVLAASAAVRAGAGMVRYVGPEAVARAVLATRPEVVAVDGWVQSWVLGPGLPATGDGVEQRERARRALAEACGRAPCQRTTVPVVVDAGALGLVDDHCPGWVVLTPHAGELAALLASRGERVDRAGVEAEPLRWARRAHELTGATVLLKGAATIVVGPGRTVYAQTDAPAWAATAGSGDVLAGLLGTMLAARSAEVVRHPERAAEVAAAAALVHGHATEHANPGGPVAALAIAEAVGPVVAALLAAR